ncbi:MHS family MFS transporter [Mycobacterium sp. 21AC1]|uniref:MFS transporter n=1 Tax=[Mycobacterium] appelbergii TaxID=2939269 RepID=UPI002938F0E3|nr:MFS transporter [Mycobacterium sp. 21AC1]MDV3129054.1 MHS family MFS transporter [Mycobacterium sp. 21AC1]
MVNVTDQKPPTTSKLRRVVAASMAGTVIEWYEFLLYSASSALVFGTLFFPESDNALDGVINALLIYAVGFIARPLGGLVFGYFGDRVGRKKLLQVSLLLVGASTFAIGCIPGYASIGMLAPLILVALRFLQGVGVGGEWGGAVLLVAEHSPNESRSFWTSWPQAALPLGNFVATLVLMGLSFVMPEAAFLSYGWRIAFWLSALIVIVGYYIRTKVDEAPLFVEAREAAEKSAEPTPSALQVIKKYPRQVLIAMGARVAENIMYQMVVTFSITYLAFTIGSTTTEILGLILGAHAIHFIVVPLFGRLADSWGRKPVFLLGSVLAIGWGFVGFPLLSTGNDFFIFLGITLGLLVHGLMYAPQPAMMAEMFPTRMRYTGVSLGYQVTSIFAGSLAPFISTSLLRSYESWVPVACYLAVAAVISTVAVSFLTETKGIDLADLDARPAEPRE